ncbi:winged helix-turn-helix domain-containing protein [Solwaraspora sp. WMMD792]|uniref:GntR family transcriptional regulator n=1 Tax=Solwaraspora sp. WMMD792 TaxID=3016099 RepID=UPI00241725D4|nr:winged helix-turn-helix domain-containing protein [Solwaraspora sp. WMMD792]MDG4774066.1 winged helix-turn-helix domain-containing protein [Solwaraspora sp. WMMD792]
MPTPHYGTPRYRRVADQLRDRITSGAIPPGALLPAETALAKEFNVARGTIRAAINALRQDGLVTTEHGRGTHTRPTPALRSADRDHQDDADRASATSAQRRYVVHIPIHAHDLTAAIQTARTIAATLVDARPELRGLDYRSATVTADEEQAQHHRVT